MISIKTEYREILHTFVLQPIGRLSSNFLTDGKMMFVLLMG